MRLRLLLALLGVPLFWGGCGGRTPLDPGEPEPPPEPQCQLDEDCPLFDPCVPMACQEQLCMPLERRSCDDDDPCTDDICDSGSGECGNFPLSFDNDGDGFNGPRPGFGLGVVGACGEDCDDTSNLAFPGGAEICDGVDNDCNGVIDDGAFFEPTMREAIPLFTDGDVTSSVADLAFDGRRYAATLAVNRGRPENRFVRLGEDLRPEIDVSLSSINAESFSGPLLWNGAFYGVAWHDRRQDDNYEVYFNRLDGSGKKLGPDIRLTDTPNFSRRVQLAFDGAEFVVVWEEYAARTFDSTSAIFSQRISKEGQLRGGNVLVSPEGQFADFPALALGMDRVGIAFTSTVGEEISGKFMTHDFRFAEAPAIVDLGRTNVKAPAVYYSEGRFFVIWSEVLVTVGDAIWGMVFDEQGNVLRQASPITQPAAFARTPALLPLGDRSLLFWAADEIGDQNYELFMKMVDQNLEDLSAPTRLTFAPGRSTGPSPRFGPEGHVGIAFEDDRTGAAQAYFLELQCLPLD